MSTTQSLKSKQEDDSKLRSQIMEIQSIVPEISVDTIRACLLDPRYAGDVGKAMDALLDGYTPPAEVEEAKPVIAKPPPSAKTHVQERRNVFDAEALDISKLRIGKQCVDSTEYEGVLSDYTDRCIPQMWIVL